MKRAASMLALALTALAGAAWPVSANATELIADGGFEASALEEGHFTLTNPYWESVDERFGTTFCEIAFCGDQGAGPRFGRFWSWMGSTSNDDATRMAQSVDFPAGGTATLSFYLWLFPFGAPSSDARMIVSIDGDELLSFGRDTVGFLQYAKATTDVSTYADGKAHILRFEYVTPPDPEGLLSISVDDVSIDHQPALASVEPPGPTASTVPVASCQGERVTLTGTSGADLIVGTEARDVIAGLGGDDRISGVGGDDLICGGDGEDHVNGGGGIDDAHGQSGADNVRGGGQDDHVDGGPGGDALDGGPGADYCVGWTGGDGLKRCESGRD